MADEVIERQDAGESAARNLQKNPGIIKNIMRLLLFFFHIVYKIGTH